MNKLDNAFIAHTSDILADTETGLSGNKIVEYFNSYAVDFNRKTPFNHYPFKAKNKRTAFRMNLNAFEAAEQFRIIKELCELPKFDGNKNVKNLKLNLYKRYGSLATEKISETELVQKTKHWLANHNESLKQYESALAKYEGEIFERNTLDDMRLSFELLVKDLLNNEKSLENQISNIGNAMKTKGVSSELRNMVTQIIRYYTDFQNNHIKHDDKVNSDEIEYVIELTSVVMKYLIKILEDKDNG